MSEIHLATVLPGATGFKEGNVNETFRGQILLADGAVRSAILKDLDPKQLANEMVVSVLAKSAGLPTPDAYIALVRGSDLAVTKAPALPDGNRVVFASVDVKVPNITFRLQHANLSEKTQILADIVQWADLGQLYAFDTWVANVDRHAGNLLFSGRNDIWLIDHGHCLSGPAWQAADLKPDAKYRNRLSEWLTVHLTPDQRGKRSSETDAFVQKISSFDVSSLAEKSRIGGLLSANEFAVVKDFLKERIKEVSLNAKSALGVPGLI